MPLADILTAIRSDTDTEIAALLAEARDEVSSIEARARRDGEAAADAIAEAAEERARSEAGRIVAFAHSSAERRLAEALENEYCRVLDHLHRALSQIRGTPRYRAVLQVLLEEALNRLPDATVVSVNPLDVPLVDELLTRRDGPKPIVDASLASIGGVSVSTDDGRAVHNTFEIRIQRADGLLRAIAGCFLDPVGSPR